MLTVAVIVAMAIGNGAANPCAPRAGILPGEHPADITPIKPIMER